MKKCLYIAVIVMAGFLPILGTSNISLAATNCAESDLNCRAKVYRDYYRKQLLKMGLRVQRDEPYLPRTEFTEDFANLQEWVHRHERFVTKNKRGMDLIFVKPVRSLSLDRDVAPVFEKMYQTYMNYLSEFPYNLEVHLSMFTDEDYHSEFKGKLISAFGEIIYSLAMTHDDDLPYFNSKACDYFTQPFNGLWYSLHSMLLIDKMMSDLKTEEWSQYKTQNGFVVDRTQMESVLSELIVLVNGVEF